MRELRVRLRASGTLAGYVLVEWLDNWVNHGLLAHLGLHWPWICEMTDRSYGGPEQDPGPWWRLVRRREYRR